ncbi:FGGY family carbohydrate kinase [Parasedimentitalea psychrophila]|uniref:ATP:glycerol 3-phosphotransferase n=1 Tax=Parasedimentitalea psychrophila TaxID=2997337 RepID=A0A9Y2P8S0_9RHOB|nr:FGGY family carbohydrate kinase [Parasedimentitalea psychrophila]WIY27348.1 FGGY family carbohydrate kinase [Parasedimentitalea psychrophila]
MRVVAIDQGTSSTRGFVLDETGLGKIICTRAHRQIYPQPGWVEHDPEELLQHVTDCIRAAGPVDAIGIDNQGESCLAWNGDTGEAISPVIVWQDRRTEARIASLKADGAEQLTMAKAGLPLDPYFSASKLAWILDNIAEARPLLAQGKLRLGTTDAFFLDRLTGHFATDITTASRTSLLGLETGQWAPELCALFGVPIQALPEIRPSMADFGAVRLDGCATPITVNVVDQQASLFGHGCRNAGAAKITFGTGAFAMVLTGDTLLRAPDQGLLPTIAWQATGSNPVCALDGGVYCASSALNWARSLGLFKQFDEINSFDAPAAIGRNLAFVPALTGLGCPHWDGSAAGLWIGMSLDTSAKDMVQAILEGIALRADQVITAMDALVPIGDRISIDGGMSANPYFCQFLSDVLQKQIIVQPMGEQTALGTALMVAGDPPRGTANAPACLRYDPAPEAPDKTLFAEAVSRSRNWRPKRV